MKNTHMLHSACLQRRAGFALIFLVASLAYVKPAQAGTEEAIAGILLGAILISAAQDSHASPVAHCCSDSHSPGHDHRHGWSHGGPHAQIPPTHQPRQRGYGYYSAADDHHSRYQQDRHAGNGHRGAANKHGKHRGSHGRKNIHAYNNRGYHRGY